MVGTSVQLQTRWLNIPRRGRSFAGRRAMGENPKALRCDCGGLKEAGPKDVLTKWQALQKYIPQKWFPLAKMRPASC